jgi:hypothetical protein
MPAQLPGVTRRQPLESGFGVAAALLSLEYAAHVLYALAAPELYLILTTDRTWTQDTYRQWLSQQLIHALMPPPP